MKTAACLSQVAGLEGGEVEAAWPVVHHHTEAPQLSSLEKHLLACAYAHSVLFQFPSKPVMLMDKRSITKQ